MLQDSDRYVGGEGHDEATGEEEDVKDIKDYDALLPKDEASEKGEPTSPGLLAEKREHWKFHRAMLLTPLVVAFGLLSSCWPLQCFAAPAPQSCDSVQSGYQCQNNISHNWGQYSPYFTVPSTIPDVVPLTCEVSFAQVLSRHGSRFPTTSKSVSYNATVAQIKKNVNPAAYTGKYAFLASYTYTLGAEDLTLFGQQEMINSGTKFYGRYKALTTNKTPFIRASSQDRVVVSAKNFSQGFHAAKAQDILSLPFADPYPYGILVISEDVGFNNTLSHDLCTAFETGPDSKIGASAQAQWAAIFVPPIRTRLNSDLPGAALTASQVIGVMDLCPFNTVASDTGDVSPFCGLFTVDEFQQYAYYQSLGKYYGYGNGNPLGSTQGVGFTNELIARMTGRPVQDMTSTNRTLDSDMTTFPYGPGHNLFADFSHDNDLSGHFAAMGLYNTTAPLSNSTRQNEETTNGYSAAYTVAFGARAYFEKQRCLGQSEELVRILVNDRVIHLQNCGADSYGRCRLSAWVSSLSFARNNGFWNQQCFT